MKPKEEIKSVYQIAQQSKQLPEIAERAVEIAIEDSENSAMNWIDGQIMFDD